MTAYIIYIFICNINEFCKHNFMNNAILYVHIKPECYCYYWEKMQYGAKLSGRPVNFRSERNNLGRLISRTPPVPVVVIATTSAVIPCNIPLQGEHAFRCHSHSNFAANTKGSSSSIRANGNMNGMPLTCFHNDQISLVRYLKWSSNYFAYTSFNKVYSI